MGRPLNKKYFGNRNTPPIGGEGVASIAISGTNTGYTAIPTIQIGAPSLPTGVQAVASVASMGVVGVTVVAGGTGYTNGDVITLVGAVGSGTAATLTVTNAVGGVIQAGGVTIATAGAYTTIDDRTAVGVTGPGNDDATFDLTFKINAVSVTTPGSGYTSAPTVTDSPDGNAAFTATLTSTRDNAITMNGRVVAGSTVALDIVKQSGSRRFLATDGTNTGIVRLTSSAPAAAGEAAIVATDSAGGTYYVTKLTTRRALLVPGTGTQFSENQMVPWVLDTAVENVSVRIPSA